MSTVRILKKAKYNDRFGRAHPREVGDLHPTIGWYADLLVESEVAEHVEPEDLPVVEDEPVEPVEALFTDVNGVTEGVNTALLAVGYTWAMLAEAKVADLTPISGLGAKMATKLIDRAKAEVEKDDETSSD